MVLLCGIVFRMISKAFLFYGLFLVLRRYCGGYHAETYLRCNVIFTIMMLIVLTVILFYENIPSTVVAIQAFISFLIVLRYSPLIHKNKCVLENETVKYRMISRVISALFLIMVFLFLLNHKEIALIISLSMLVTSIALLVAVIHERRQVA